MRIHRHSLTLMLALLAPLSPAQAQSTPDIQQILQRLDRLESENRELRERLTALERELESSLASAEARGRAPAQMTRIERLEAIVRRARNAIAELLADLSDRVAVSRHAR